MNFGILGFENHNKLGMYLTQTGTLYFEQEDRLFKTATLTIKSGDMVFFYETDGLVFTRGITNTTKTFKTTGATYAKYAVFSRQYQQTKSAYGFEIYDEKGNITFSHMHKYLKPVDTLLIGNGGSAYGRVASNQYHIPQGKRYGILMCGFGIAYIPTPDGEFHYAAVSVNRDRINSGWIIEHLNVRPNIGNGAIHIPAAENHALIVDLTNYV